jgi:hypothetical protein
MAVNPIKVFQRMTASTAEGRVENVTITTLAVGSIQRCWPWMPMPKKLQCASSVLYHWLW